VSAGMHVTVQRPSTHSGPSGCPSQSMSSTHPPPPLELLAPVLEALVVVAVVVVVPSPVVGTVIPVLPSPVSLVLVSTGTLSPNDPPVPLPPPLQAVRTMQPNAAPLKPWIIDASAADLWPIVVLCGNHGRRFSAPRRMGWLTALAHTTTNRLAQPPVTIT